MTVSQSIYSSELRNQNRSERLAERAANLGARDTQDLVVLGVGAAYLQIVARAAQLQAAEAELRSTQEFDREQGVVNATLHPVYRRLVRLTLEELPVLEDHLGQLDQQMAQLLAPHHDAVQRLAEVPGLGLDSAQQITTIRDFPASLALFDDGQALLLADLARRSNPPCANEDPHSTRSESTGAGHFRWFNAGHHHSGSVYLEEGTMMAATGHSEAWPKISRSRPIAVPDARSFMVSGRAIAGAHHTQDEAARSPTL